MELQRGICSLCSESGRVFTSADTDVEAFLSCLPQILYENFLTEAEFQKIKDLIKVCSICCYKLELANEIKKKMVNDTTSNSSDAEEEKCNFCSNTKCVVKAKDDWKFVVLRTDTVLKTTDFPVNICYRCLFYFDTIFQFKTKLLFKFPLLALKSPKATQKQNDTPKRKSLSHSPPNSKRRKIFDNCFTYLQPLSKSTFHVDDKVKMDDKMYKKIAYVNVKKNETDTNLKMKDVKDIKEETPKVRPVIKIKLKSKAKKSLPKKPIETIEIPDTIDPPPEPDSNFMSQPYVKLCKTEEVLDKEEEDQSRQSSPIGSIEEQKEDEEKIEETPKSASTTAPKRRVSLYAEPNDVEVDTENIPDVDSQVNSDDINNIVEKYIKDTTFNDSDKLDLLQEIEENVEKHHEENGFSEEKPLEESPEEINLTLSEDPVIEHTEEDEVTPAKSPLLSEITLRKTPTKSDSDGSDSDVSDKSKSKSNLDGDSFSGSERKKKRVTFSDEINE